jgi:hypothetical protein
MVGWLLVIVLSLLLFFAADSVVYVVTWVAAWLEEVFLSIGVEVEIFKYLDTVYPYMRSTTQALGIGIFAVAVLAVVAAIKERV